MGYSIPAVNELHRINTCPTETLKGEDMGVKFGEIDANQILENEFRIGVLEKLLEWIADNNITISRPSKQNVQDIKKAVVADLQRKYPKSGISFSGD